MIDLKPPVNPKYDYKSLAYFVGVWWSAESREPWVGSGFAPATAMCKRAVSSRQWDASAGLLDDELEKSTATLMGECVDKLDAVDRATVMYGLCLVRCAWVEQMEPARAQQRYEGALDRLARLAKAEGVDV